MGFGDEEGFRAPRFGGDVAADEYLRECPSASTTRGTFFANVVELVQTTLGRVDDRLYEGLSSRRWLAFNNYPLRDFMRLAYNAARVAYPNVPVGEGLRRVGWMSFPSFAATMAGRVVLFAFGQRLEDVIVAAPKSYALTLPGCTVTVQPVGERHVRFQMRSVYSFVETYHAGVLEGAVRTLGHQPTILVRPLARRCDADFDVRWV